MAHKDNNSLPLRLVLSVLERQLSNLDRSQEVSISVNLNVVDGVGELIDVIRLGEAHLNSINQKINKFHRGLVKRTFFQPC